ncbi:MAG: glycosyltransferase [Candidatus Nanopusillus acidilobi]
MERIKLAAIIVTYNPEIYRFKDVITSILNQVDFIIIVDNGSKNINDIKEICSIKSNIEIIENDINYGIGKALNIGIEKLRNNYDWILTLDQDSIILVNIVDIINDITKIYDKNMIGLIYLNTKDENKKTKYDKTKKPIISGSIINSKIFSLGIVYREEFFMDQIDFDFDYNIIINKFKIIKTNFKSQDHEQGKKLKTIFGKYLNYEPEWRIYLIARNSFKLLLEKKIGLISFFNQFLLWYVLYVIVVPFKFKKIYNYLYLYLIGIKDAIKNNMGVSENLKRLMTQK